MAFQVLCHAPDGVDNGQQRTKWRATAFAPPLPPGPPTPLPGRARADSHKIEYIPEPEHEVISSQPAICEAWQT